MTLIALRAPTTRFISQQARTMHVSLRGVSTRRTTNERGGLPMSERIADLKAELDRVNKLRAALAKTVDDQADEISRLKAEIQWYAETGRKPRKKRAVAPLNKDGTKLKPFANDSTSVPDKSYHRGLDRLFYGS
jgi:hypothetical protein